VIPWICLTVFTAFCLVCTLAPIWIELGDAGCDPEDVRDES
jgi:hypothetical protein